MLVGCILLDIALFTTHLLTLIHSIHLPPVTIDVGITAELLEEDKKLTGRYVVLVKGYRILDFMSA